MIKVIFLVFLFLLLPLREERPPLLQVNDFPLIIEVVSKREDRVKGLSGREYLPKGEAMLFVFEEEGRHSIWMKDMYFSIDIIWISKEGEVIYIKEEVSPETFPEAFSPKEKAKYVLETNAGFVKKVNLKVGDKIEINF